MNKTLTPIVLIVIAVALFFWQINPQYQMVTELRAQSTQYDEALRVADELKELQNELAQKYDSFSPNDLGRLETFLPDHMDTVRIILDVNGIAGRYGIVPRNMTTAEIAPTGAASQKVFNTGTLSFDFTAPYLDIVDFMKDLERSLRLIDIRSIDITPATPGANKTGIGYDVKITLNTYWLIKK